MEIMDGFTRWDNIRNAAYNCRAELDKTSNHFLPDYAEYTYTEFLEEKAKNPTIASIAMHEEYLKRPIKHTQAFKENVAALSENHEVRKLQDSVNKKIDSLYPKTRAIREILIENDRLSLTETKPKLTGLKKFILGLKTKI